ncbi:MAG: hypothetical protein ACO3SJ_02070, partial [Phycisphaerales bacterium]
MTRSASRRFAAGLLLPALLVSVSVSASARADEPSAAQAPSTAPEKPIVVKVPGSTVDVELLPV